MATASAFEPLPPYIPLGGGDDDQHLPPAGDGDDDDDPYSYLEIARLIEAEVAAIWLQEFLLPGGDGERFGPPGPRLPPVHRNPFPSRQERAASESSARAAPPPPTFPGAAAATAADISCLGKRKYEGPRAGEYSTECVICIEEFEVGDDLSTMPCPHGHRFHEKCLAKWLARRRSCPLCRHLLPANSTNIHSV